MKCHFLAFGLCLTAAPGAYALNPDVRLSGTFGLGLSYFHDDSNISNVSDLDVENNASNFRIEAASNEVGIRAFATYERGASNDQQGVEDVRQFFGGISNRYGTLLYGRKATDYRIAGERLDPFYNTSVAGFNGQFASEGASYGLSNLTNGFTSNTVAYRSPSLAGVNFNLAAYVNDNNNQGSGDRADGGAGVGYTNADWLGLDVNLQGLKINGNVVAGSPAGQSRAGRLSATFGQKLWATGVSFEWVDVRAEADARQYLLVSGSYQVLQALRLAATYGHVNNSPSFDGNGATIGAFYDLMQNLSVYAAVRRVDLSNGNEDKVTTGAMGVKFVFDVDL